jgi:CO dehydrogenase maturation factor
MKLAISGKGGVGKTTLSALLAKAFANKGYQVLAIDADPDANLAAALGFKDPDSIKPIAEMGEMILERTGARPGTIGGLFTMNPRVDDLPERLSAEVNGIKLMRMGTVKKGGGGCVCPESTLLRALVQHLLIDRKEVVLMDMEAGIEHLGRGTAGFVDRLIVVVEPGRRSIETAEKIRRLASQIHLERIAAVGNKIRTEADRAFILEHMKDIPVIGFLPFMESIIQADMNSMPPFEAGGESLLLRAAEIAEMLIEDKGSSSSV